MIQKEMHGFLEGNGFPGAKGIDNAKSVPGFHHVIAAVCIKKEKGTTRPGRFLQGEK